MSPLHISGTPKVLTKLIKWRLCNNKAGWYPVILIQLLSMIVGDKLGDFSYAQSFISRE